MLSVDPVAYIEQTYRIQLKRASGEQYCGPCIFCGGTDRFLVWRDTGNFYCRPGPGHCERKGWIDELTGESLTPEQRRLLALESKQRQMEREQQEQERRLSALEQMHRCTDHLRYHFDMTTDQMEYWLNEGMTVDTIAAYELGFCPRCPTDRDGRASYTIPVLGHDGQTLVNIRHRLLGANDGNKYRPHMANLGAQLFNARFTNTPANSIVVCEGEKKSICLDQYGFASVGVMGHRSFKREWLEWLNPFPTVYVALDPDAKDSAERLAAMFNGRGRVVDLPVKADDFFTRFGGTKDDFKWFISQGKPIKAD